MAKLSDRATKTVNSLGEYLAEQRRHAQLSLRQLSDLAGVSNPYLSQIERGLRKPSADMLQQLAKTLQISTKTLYIQTSILDPNKNQKNKQPSNIIDTILLNPTLNERQKQMLLNIYASFIRKNTPTTD